MNRRAFLAFAGAYLLDPERLLWRNVDLDPAGSRRVRRRGPSPIAWCKVGDILTFAKPRAHLA